MKSRIFKIFAGPKKITGSAEKKFYNNENVDTFSGIKDSKEILTIENEDFESVSISSQSARWVEKWKNGIIICPMESMFYDDDARMC
jgi:hypothetical protein